MSWLWRRSGSHDAWCFSDKSWAGVYINISAVAREKVMARRWVLWVDQFSAGHDLKDGPMRAVVAAWESSASSGVAAIGRGSEPPSRFASGGVFIGALTPAFTGDKLARIRIETHSVAQGGCSRPRATPSICRNADGNHTDARPGGGPDDGNSH